MHNVHLPTIGTRFNVDEQEKTAEYWVNAAQAALQSKVSNRLITSEFILQNKHKHFLSIKFLDKAKNIILFLGDGMSIPTLAASRIYLSQLRNQSGTESSLSFDRFPFSGLSKVSC